MSKVSRIWMLGCQSHGAKATRCSSEPWASARRCRSCWAAAVTLNHAATWTVVRLTVTVPSLFLFMLMFMPARARTMQPVLQLCFHPSESRPRRTTNSQTLTDPVGQAYTQTLPPSPPAAPPGGVPSRPPCLFFPHTSTSYAVTHSLEQCSVARAAPPLRLPCSVHG